jgi:predicted nucleic-acid-binding Zn-ribbon protein
MTTKDECSKCGGTMSEGFVIDYGDYQVKQQQIWVEGEPQASFWSGLKTSGKQAFKVRAFRCENCNFLEFYTAEEVDLSGLFN